MNARSISMILVLVCALAGASHAQTPPRLPAQITPQQSPQHPALRTLRTPPVTIDTPELAFVGGANAPADEAEGPPVTVNAAELAFVGGATEGAAASEGPPVVVNTPELAFVGS